MAGRPITAADVHAYVRYADLYYGSAYGTGSTGDCAQRHAPAACRAVLDEALSRLIQERVVAAYATAHHIVLTRSDEHRINVQLAGLRLTDPTTARLLQTHALAVTFLRKLLRTEALVSKVEDRVTSGAADMGYSFHVREFSFPAGGAGGSPAAYRQAVHLATDGKPVPLDATESSRWIAAFRLSQPEVQSLRAASDGNFVGPFQRSGTVLVLQRLGAGMHRYGRPARAELRTRLFKQWLAEQIRRESPVCYGSSGKTVHCPAGA